MQKYISFFEQQISKTELGCNKALFVLYSFAKMCNTRNLQQLTRTCGALGKSDISLQDVEQVFRSLGTNTTEYAKPWQHDLHDVFTSAARELVNCNMFENESQCFTHLRSPLLERRLNQTKMKVIFDEITDIVNRRYVHARA